MAIKLQDSLINNVPEFFFRIEWGIIGFFTYTRTPKLGRNGHLYGMDAAKHDLLSTPQGTQPG